MSHNARRRYLKIVAPLAPNREQELIGGLKNAIYRGETIMKAKQSFINAGYKQAEVEVAAQKVPAATTQISKPILKNQTSAQQQAPTQIKPTATTTKSKKLSKTFIIILIISSALILIGAAILGLFWDSWFG